MKLTVADRAGFERCVDGAAGTDASIVLRYRNAVRFDDPEERDRAIRKRLPACSIREGARILPLFSYRDVAVHVLDETTSMETGSIKSIDGCLTASICLAEGTGRIAFESGGNTGSALTRYGRNAGIETFFFCPLGNVDLLDSGIFPDGRAHLVAVEEPGKVKEFSRLFAERAGIRLVPNRSWRYGAGMFRGLFLVERMLSSGAFDWISQTVSAAFGPIGIYRVLETFRKDLGGLPRFLGVQQEANCPLFRAWKPADPGSSRKGETEGGRLLSRIMYDASPETHGTWDELRRILLTTRGDLVTVNEGEFGSRLDPSAGCGSILRRLDELGIGIGRRAGEIPDKAGLIALAGTLNAIDAGTIPPGNRVLCALTGGAGAADGRARPERTAASVRDILEYVGTIGEGR